MSKQEIIDSLKGYQNGTYGGPMKGVMLGQVKKLTDADINETKLMKWKREHGYE